MFTRRLLALLGAAVVLLASTSANGADPAPVHVRVTAVGDLGATTHTASVLSALGAIPQDAAFALGDLSYGVTGEEQAWCDFVTSKVGEGFPFELLAGNHESNGVNGNINDFSSCLPNQLPGLVGTYGRQYYVDLPKVDPVVRFVMTSPNLAFPDGQWNYPAGSPRYQWTANTIDAARTKGIPWVVVGMHKPCLSMGVYNCDIGRDFAELMLSKKVDLVLNGHEHIYQRTKQLALRSGCTQLAIADYNPACVVDGDAELRKGAGTVFATVGTGGSSTRDVTTTDPEAPYFAAWSGANANPTTGFADLDFSADKLQLKFVPVTRGDFTDSLTITKDSTPPANEPPVAAFTQQVTGMTAALDGSTSSDPDGTITSYAWNFGDGTTGTGARVNHTYDQAGTYRVSLTVTDDAGAEAVRSVDVVVTAPPAENALARDTFERTTANGWGRADLGGDWVVSGGASRFSVAGGVGRMSTLAGSTLYAALPPTSTNARVTATFSVDKLAEAHYVAVVGREVGTERYVARMRLQADGGARLHLLRGTGTALGTYFQTPFSIVPGEKYKLSFQVSGTSPTTLSAKIWRAGDPEPAAWQRTASDSFAGLQSPGRAGIFSTMPSGAANAPVTVSVDDVSVVPPN